jgi:hypothetical protein
MRNVGNNILIFSIHIICILESLYIKELIPTAEGTDRLMHMIYEWNNIYYNI